MRLRCGPFHQFSLHADQVRNCGPLWKHWFNPVKIVPSYVSLFSLSNVLYILAFPKFFSPKRCKLRVSVLTMIKRYKLGAGWLEALFSVWEYWIIDVNLIHIHIYFKVGEEDKTEKVCLLSATLGHSSVFILVCILVNLRLRRYTE